MLKKLLRQTALVAAVTLAGLASVQAEEAPIKIGSFLSVTGPAAFLGDPELKTLQLYIDKINEEGGIQGRKLELVHYDDAGDAAKANTFVKRLIESDGVDVIIGGTTTGTTMAAVPLVERAEIPFISLAGAVVIIEPVKPWVFKTPHTDRMAAQRIFEHLHKNGISKIGLISGTGGFGKSGREQTLAVAPTMGIEIVADETYGPKDTDVTAQLTKIKNAPGVQAVLNFDFGQGPAIVTKNYRQLGIELPLYQSHGVASKQFLELAGAAAEGVRLPAAALLVADKLPADDPQKPVVTAYTEAYTKAYNEDVSTFGGHAYDGLMIAVDALKRAGSSDKAAIRTAIEQTHGYIGTGGIVNMTPDDHLGLNLNAFRMLEVHNGTWSLLD